MKIKRIPKVYGTLLFRRARARRTILPHKELGLTPRVMIHNRRQLINSLNGTSLFGMSVLPSRSATAPNKCYSSSSGIFESSGFTAVLDTSYRLYQNWRRSCIFCTATPSSRLSRWNPVHACITFICVAKPRCSARERVAAIARRAHGTRHKIFFRRKCTFYSSHKLRGKEILCTRPSQHQDHNFAHPDASSRRALLERSGFNTRILAP